MRSLTLLVSMVGCVVLCGCASGDSSGSRYGYRLECRVHQTFEKCGQIFDTHHDCMVAQNEMIRAEARLQERGDCERVAR